MGAVEQDLARHLRQVDQDDDDAAAEERAAVELREEIEQDVEDLETALSESVEHGDFPFAPLARMLIIQAHTDDPREFIRRVRAAIEPRIKAMVDERVPGRIKQWQDDADQARADARDPDWELNSWF
jgi:hypothetical protein